MTLSAFALFLASAAADLAAVVPAADASAIPEFLTADAGTDTQFTAQEHIKP